GGAAVWIDGDLVAPDAAKLSVFDHGFTVGDGVFETVRVIAGRPFALGRHLARLHRSADRLGLAVPVGDPELRAVGEDVLAAAGLPAARLRITVTGGVTPLGSGRARATPSLVVAAGPLAPWPPETTAVTVPWPRNERSAVAGAKTTSFAENVVALAEAR